MLKIIYFGTPLFSATVLDYLFRQNIKILACVTKPDKPRGRSKQPLPSPVKTFAQAHDIPIFQPRKASDPEFAEKNLKPLDADLFVVVAYSEILKENLLTMPRLGCINVHASLLPKYRGAAPIQCCIMAGDTESGVTIMSMEKELDAGGMLAVAKTKIGLEMTAGQLSEVLSKIGAKALWQVLQEVESGKAEPIIQDVSKVTYAPKLTSEDGQIDWSKPAQAVHNHIRGVTPKPGAWCWIQHRGKMKRLLVIKTSLEIAKSPGPGELVPGPCLDVGCGEGVVRLLEVKLEGKQALSAEDFLRGIQKKDLLFNI